MKVERMIGSIGGCCSICAVLCDSTNIVSSSETRVNSRLTTCARICGIFCEAFADEVLFVSEAFSGDYRT